MNQSPSPFWERLVIPSWVFHFQFHFRTGSQQRNSVARGTFPAAKGSAGRASITHGRFTGNPFDVDILLGELPEYANWVTGSSGCIGDFQPLNLQDVLSKIEEGTAIVLGQCAHAHTRSLCFRTGCVKEVTRAPPGVAPHLAQAQSWGGRQRADEYANSGRIGPPVSRWAAYCQVRTGSFFGSACTSVRRSRNVCPARAAVSSHNCRGCAFQGTRNKRGLWRRAAWGPSQECPERLPSC